MKYLLMLFCMMALTSCYVYRYGYDNENMEIVSKKGDSITSVIIESEQGIILAIFMAVSGTRSNEFSLKTFSPEKFKRTAGDLLKLEQGIVYSIFTRPQGGAAGIPIKVRLQPDGRIIEIPLTSPELQKGFQKTDSTDQIRGKN